MKLDERETEKGQWAIICIIASILLGGLMLAYQYFPTEFMPWI